MMAAFNMESIGWRAKEASIILASASTDQKNAALQAVADALLTREQAILAANAADVADARTKGLNDALIDRLMLTSARLAGIASDTRAVAKLPDPVGEEFEICDLPNGLNIRKRRTPVGVIGAIYESRPNVTIDIAALALKSGNAVILRGGSETFRSNMALADALRHGLQEASLPSDAILYLEDTDRAHVLTLLTMDRFVDMIIPRGGAGLHDFCRRNATIPVITGGIGICHLFVDSSADLQRSIDVICNAKTQRPSVCNALDTVLVHQTVAGDFLPRAVSHLAEEGVTFRAEPRALAILGEASGVSPAGPDDFDQEWLSLVLGLKVVDGLDEAIAHVRAHSTGHSDGILTADPANAERFVTAVDSAVVYVNASTRFTDGSQLGLGAEVAISTQKLHARGPMALKELTTYKWIVRGDMNIRP